MNYGGLHLYKIYLILDVINISLVKVLRYYNFFQIVEQYKTYLIRPVDGSGMFVRSFGIY